MSDLIACLLIWLGEPLRRTLRSARQRARTWLTPPPPPPPAPLLLAPLAWHDPQPEHVRARCEPLDGHEVAFLRPYYRAHEQAVAAEYVRRAAVALAT